MNPQKTIQGTFWAMIVVQTISGVDRPGKGARKLPAPGRYVAAVVLWAVMHLTASIAPSLARTMAGLSVAVLLTAMFVASAGQTPAAQTLIGFFETVSRLFNVRPPAAAPAAPLGAPASPSSGARPVVRPRPLVRPV